MSDIFEELSALIDGALPDARAAELRRRIEKDAVLRAEYEALRRTLASVRGLPRERAPAALRRNVLAATARRGPAPLLRWGRWGGLATAAAATLLVAFLVFFADRDGAGPVQTTASDEPSEKDKRKGETGKAAGLAEIATKSEYRVARDDAAGVVDSGAGEAVEEARRRESPGRRSQRRSEKEEVDEESPDAGMLLAKMDRKSLKERMAVRSHYLAELRRLSDQELSVHFGALIGAESFRADSLRKVAESLPFATVVVGSIEEARTIERILNRTYPPAPRGAVEGEARGKPAAPAAPARAGQLAFELEASPDELARVLLWLDKIGDPVRGKPGLKSSTVKKHGARLAGGGDSGKGTAAGGRSGRSAKRTVRIRVLYAAPRKKGG